MNAAPYWRSVRTAPRLPAPVLEDRMVATAFRSTGFDYLRLILASAVILAHTIDINQGIDAAIAVCFSAWRPLLVVIVPMFFALSGFLVTASLIRCRSLMQFLVLRATRIMPALTAEVAFSALVIGPIFTSLPLPDYFRSRGFFTHFLNIVGYLQPVLPGVLSQNPAPGLVNFQLWTVSFELGSYLLLAGLAAVGLVWRRGLFLATLCAAQVAAAVHMIAAHPPRTPVLNGENLMLCFFWGAACFAYRDIIKWHAGLLLVSLVSTVVLLLMPGGDYIVGAPIAYATIYIGLFNPPKPRLLFAGDYSYGMYLYGAAVQQVVAFWPWTRTWYWSAPISLVVTFAVAHLSWRLVEQPSLRWRGRLIAGKATTPGAPAAAMGEVLSA